MFFLWFLGGAALQRLSVFFPFVCLAVFACLTIMLILRKSFLFLIAFGAAFAYAAFIMPPQDDEGRIPTGRLKAVGMFLPGSQQTASGEEMNTFFVEEACDEESSKELIDFHDERIVIFGETGADPEERYEVLLDLREAKEYRNPGARLRGRPSARIMEMTAAKERSGGLKNYFQGLRNRLNAFFMERFSGDTGGFLSAVTTGERAYLSEGLQRDFAVSGLAHLLSISGTHFGLFSLMIFGSVRVLISRLPHRLLLRLSLFLSPQHVAALATFPVMIFYLGLSGASIPAVRSFVMISLFLIGLLIGRRRAWLNALFFAGFLLVLTDPDVLFSLSFLLSFCAVLFIGFAVEDREHDNPGERKTARFLKSTLLITLAATAGTAPLVAYYFHAVSVVSPLANLAVAPLVGFIVVPSAVLASFVQLIAGLFPLSSFIGALTDAALAFVRFFARLPYADLPVAAFPPILLAAIYAGFLPFILKKDRRLLAIPVVPILLYALTGLFSQHRLSATFVDVGQGDSAVVELPDGKTLVVDAGMSGRQTADLLRLLGKRQIDALVLSHHHPDHSGGADYILKNFRVKELWRNSPSGEAGGHASPAVLRVLDRGDVFRGEGYTITCLHPYPGFYLLDGREDDEGNSESLVLSVAGRYATFLFAGDVQDEAEEDLTHLGPWLKSDVLKVPHHGSRTSGHGGFFSAVDPAVAVLSVGRGNSFGHPSEEVMALLAGSRVLRTDRDGAIKITEDADGLRVRTADDIAISSAHTFEDELLNLKRLWLKW